jgi:hypothetical protein
MLRRLYCMLRQLYCMLRRLYCMLRRLYCMLIRLYWCSRKLTASLAPARTGDEAGIMAKADQKLAGNEYKVGNIRKAIFNLS